LLILCAAAAATWVSIEMRTRLERAKQKNHQATQRVEQLQIEAERIEKELRLLETDPAFLESFARVELGLVRPGDVVIKLDPSDEIQTREIIGESLSGNRSGLASGARPNGTPLARTSRGL
jgi:hypothetical protein